MNAYFFLNLNRRAMWNGLTKGDSLELAYVVPIRTDDFTIESAELAYVGAHGLSADQHQGKRSPAVGDVITLIHQGVKTSYAVCSDGIHQMLATVVNPGPYRGPDVPSPTMAQVLEISQGGYPC